MECISPLFGIEFTTVVTVSIDWTGKCEHNCSHG